MTSDRAARRERLTGTAIGALLVAVMIGFTLLAVSMLLTMRAEIRSDTLRTSRNLLCAELAGIDRILTIYDASLRSAADAWKNPALHDATPAVQRLAIFEGMQDTPDLGPIRILDRSGTVIYDSANATPPDATPAERAALADALTGGPNAGGIGVPFRKAGGEWAVTLSHGIPDSSAQPGGVVVGTIDLRLFEREFQKLSVGPHDTVSLFSQSGTMLAHIPGAPMIGRSIAGSDILRRFLGSEQSSFEAPAALDHVRRVFSFERLDHWKLFLDVGLSTQDLYRPWRQRALATTILMGALAILTGVLLRMLKRDLRARRLAEEHLEASEHRYRLLAESAQDVIVRADRRTIRTYVSPSCAQYGYEPEDLVGAVSSSWIHEDDLVAARTAFLRTIDEGVDAVVNYRLRTKSGEYAWVRSHVSPMQQGGYLAIIQNIEHEARAREAAPA